MHRWILPPREHLTISVDILVFTVGEGCYLPLLGKAKDAAQHPAMHKTAPQQRINQPQMSKLLRCGDPDSAPFADSYLVGAEWGLNFIIKKKKKGKRKISNPCIQGCGRTKGQERLVPSQERGAGLEMQVRDGEASLFLP